MTDPNVFIKNKVEEITKTFKNMGFDPIIILTGPVQEDRTRYTYMHSSLSTDETARLCSEAYRSALSEVDRDEGPSED